MPISPIYDEKLNGYFYKGQFTPNHCVLMTSSGFCSKTNYEDCSYRIDGMFHHCRYALMKIIGTRV